MSDLSLHSCVVCGQPSPRGADGYRRWTCSEVCLGEARRSSIHDTIRDAGYQPWTKERVVEAIQRWERRYRRLPTAREWDGEQGLEGPWATGERPSTHGVRLVFGTWVAAIEAAGFTPPGRGRWRKNPAKCRSGRHDWVDENIYYNPPSMRPTCRPCRNERKRKAKS